MDLSGLTVGETYAVQMMFAEKCCDRGFDVSVEGTVVAEDFSPRQVHGANSLDSAAYVGLTLTATDDTLNILLGGDVR